MLFRSPNPNYPPLPSNLNPPCRLWQATRPVGAGPWEWPCMKDPPSRWIIPHAGPFNGSRKLSGAEWAVCMFLRGPAQDRRGETRKGSPRLFCVGLPASQGGDVGRSACHMCLPLPGTCERSNLGNLKGGWRDCKSPTPDRSAGIYGSQWTGMAERRAG